MLKPKIKLAIESKELLPWEGASEITITPPSVFVESAKKVAENLKREARLRDLEDLKKKVEKEKELKLKRARRLEHDLNRARNIANGVLSKKEQKRVNRLKREAEKRARNVFNFENQTSKDYAKMQEKLAKDFRKDFIKGDPKTERTKRIRKPKILKAFSKKPVPQEEIFYF